MKVAYFLSHPIQYFSPMLRLLNSAPGIELIVYYGHNPQQFKHVDKGFGKVIEWDIPLLEGYSYVFLKNWARPVSLNNQFWSLVNPGIISALKRDKPDIVIVHGWSYFTNCLAIISAWILGKKVWLRGENPYKQEVVKTTWLILLKRLLLQNGLFRLVDQFLYIGTENKKFYQFYGVNERKLMYCPYAVDNSFFKEKSEELKDRKDELKEKYGIPSDSIVILFSGKYIPKKRPMDLLYAFEKLMMPNISLVMVGEGELRSQMESFIATVNLKNVFLTGFINQHEISNYYALSDIFVMSSGTGETWGLVMNEAMNFNLPVVVSSSVGAAVDLVKDGENGFIYQEGDINELTNCIRTLVVDPKLRTRWGMFSARHIEKFNYQAIVDTICLKIQKYCLVN